MTDARAEASDRGLLVRLVQIHGLEWVIAALGGEQVRFTSVVQHLGEPHHIARVLGEVHPNEPPSYRFPRLDTEGEK